MHSWVVKSFTLPIAQDSDVVELVLDHAASLDGVAGVLLRSDGVAIVRHDAGVSATFLRAALAPLACA